MRLHTPHATALLALLMLCVATPAAATIISGPIVNPANGHTYYLLDQSSWTSAETEATSLGGHLATVNNAAEDAYLFSTFGTFGGVNRNLWIGLSDAATEGTFVWSSGEFVTYTNFTSGQPDNFTGNDPTGEHYVHIASNDWTSFVIPGMWNDQHNTSSNINGPYNGVVEIVPEPSTALLLTVGLVWLRGWNRRH